MKEDSEYLITTESDSQRVPFKYSNFTISYWNPLMEELEMNYTLHYARHTCATLMREAGIEEDIRKLILGHKSGDITDRYTHISEEMLVDAIDKLPSYA